MLVVDRVGDGRERSRGSGNGAEMRGGINNERVRGVVNRLDERKRMDVTRGFTGENERMVAVYSSGSEVTTGMRTDRMRGE